MDGPRGLCDKESCLACAVRRVAVEQDGSRDRIRALEEEQRQLRRGPVDAGAEVNRRAAAVAGSIRRMKVAAR